MAQISRQGAAASTLVGCAPGVCTGPRCEVPNNRHSSAGGVYMQAHTTVAALVTTCWCAWQDLITQHVSRLFMMYRCQLKP